MKIVLTSCISSLPSMHTELSAQWQSSALHFLSACFLLFLSFSKVEKRGKSFFPTLLLFLFLGFSCTTVVLFSAMLTCKFGEL